MSYLDISPTQERLRGVSYDKPEISQTVKRPAYRVHSPFEAMYRRGMITTPQFRAGSKLSKHYHGAMGVHVGDGDGHADPDTEFAQVYHGQQCEIAAKQLLADQYKAVVHLIEESADLEQIGRDWLHCKQRGQAHIAGRALVITALEVLAIHWRFKEP